MTEIKVITLKDGSRTATCGAWILCRVYPNGRVRMISCDAPARMMRAAEKALNLREGTLK